MKPLSLHADVWRKNVLKLACAFVSLAVVLLAFQEWPGMTSAGVAALGDTAYAQCLVNGWHGGFFGCVTNIGMPNGGVRTFGLPIDALAAVLLGVDGSVTFDEMQVIFAAFTALAFVGALLLFRRMTHSFWLGLFGSFIYLMAPIVSQQGGYGALRTGYALIPAYLLVDSMLLELKNHGWQRRLWIVALVILIRIFSLLCDGYSFVMSSGIALSYFLVAGLVRRRPMQAITAMAIYVVACSAAYLTYFRFVPGGESGLGVMPIDFFRGQGVDLYTLIKPSPLFWIYERVGWSFSIPVAAAFGDGSNIAFNFTGYALLFAAVLVPMGWLVRRTAPDALVGALVLSAAVAFILSLGPSLKYKSWDMTRAGESPKFTTYLMPEDKALMPLGTDFIYREIPGVKNIRVLARWQGVVHFMLVALLLVLLRRLRDMDRRGMAIVLALMAMAESLPNLPRAYREGLVRRSEIVGVRDAYLRELMQMTATGEKVLLVQLHPDAEANHYSADYLCAKANVSCYNAGGDKQYEIVRDSWPAEVEALMGRRNVEANIRQLFLDHDADVVLVTLFDLRRLAYSRAAAEVDEVAVHKALASIAASGHYLRKDGTYFISLRPSPRLLEEGGCGFRCWRQWPMIESAKRVTGWGPYGAVQDQGFNRQVNGRSALWAKVVDDPGRYYFVIGGVLLPTFSGGGQVVSAQLPSRVEKQLQAPNSYTVTLIDVQEGVRIPLGEFKISSPSIPRN